MWGSIPPTQGATQHVRESISPTRGATQGVWESITPTPSATQGPWESSTVFLGATQGVWESVTPNRGQFRFLSCTRQKAAKVGCVSLHWLTPPHTHTRSPSRVEGKKKIFDTGYNYFCFCIGALEHDCVCRRCVVQYIMVCRMLVVCYHATHWTIKLLLPTIAFLVHWCFVA